MPLDTLERGVNVKRLTFDHPPKQERAFYDPNRDLSEGKWSNIIADLHERRARLLGEHHGIEYFPALTNAFMLQPTRSHELGTRLDDINLINDGLADPSLMKYTPFLATYYTAMKLFFPQKYQEFLQDSSRVDEVAQRLEENLNKGTIDHIFFGDAAAATILFPERIRNLDVVKSRKNEIHSYLNAISPQNMWAAFADKAAEFRIIYPESFEELGEVNEFSWNLMLDHLGKLDSPYQIGGYTEMAKNLKILSAKDTRITDTDFEIVMPKIDSLAKGLPERRKF